MSRLGSNFLFLTNIAAVNEVPSAWVTLRIARDFGKKRLKIIETKL